MRKPELKPLQKTEKLLFFFFSTQAYVSISLIQQMNICIIKGKGGNGYKKTNVQREKKAMRRKVKQKRPKTTQKKVYGKTENDSSYCNMMFLTDDHVASQCKVQ